MKLKTCLISIGSHFSRNRPSFNLNSRSIIFNLILTTIYGIIFRVKFLHCACLSLQEGSSQVNFTRAFFTVVAIKCSLQAAFYKCRSLVQFLLQLFFHACLCYVKLPCHVILCYVDRLAKQGSCLTSLVINPFAARTAFRHLAVHGTFTSFH